MSEAGSRRTRRSCFFRRRAWKPGWLTTDSLFVYTHVCIDASQTGTKYRRSPWLAVVGDEGGSTRPGAKRRQSRRRVLLGDSLPSHRRPLRCDRSTLASLPNDNQELLHLFLKINDCVRCLMWLS
jgi:hypothetical protein